jgi:hypothetical protein
VAGDDKKDATKNDSTSGTAASAGSRRPSRQKGGRRAQREAGQSAPEGGDPRRTAPDKANPAATGEIAGVDLTPRHEHGKTGTVVGTVVADGTDNGLGGVQVVLGVAGGGRPVELAETDDAGRFRFPNIAPGDHTVHLDEVPTILEGAPLRPPPGDDGYRSVTVQPGEEAEAEPILLTAVLGTVTGFVLDVASGTGLEGLRVELTPFTAAAGADALVATTTRDGRFLFTALAPGLYDGRLQAVPAGHQLRPPDVNHRDVVVDALGVEVVTPFLLEPVAVTGTIRGSVRDAENANPVAGIEMVVEPIGDGVPRLVPTGQDGTFNVPGLVPGDYRVGLRQVPLQAAGLSWRPRPPDGGERNATVAANKDTVVSTILLESLPVAGVVTGQVLDARDGSGLQGVQVALRPDGAGTALRFAETDEKGVFEFGDASAGDFVVELAQDPVPLRGHPWEPVLADPDGGRRTVRVPAGVPEVAVRPILLEPERHRIFGRVQARPGGPGAAFARVRVLDERGNHLSTVEADRNGDYEFRAPGPGRFLVEVEGGVRRLHTVELQSDNRQDLLATEDVSDDTSATPSSDFAAFPVLTESVTLPQAPGRSGAPPSSVGQTVEAALREALGWRPRANDPRSFTAALAQSFALREVEGHTVATWTPRTYAAQVQSDLGAITGAQASLYSRAGVALDAALPLLDGLYALDPAADPQDMEAIRSIVRSELTELVTELGVEGGPRLSRVDDLLDLLLRGSVQTRATTIVQGQLGQLQDRFGLVPERVDTIDEEENFTNFLTLVDYVREIDTSWQARRGFFDPTGDAVPFLGTQLVLLSRSLAVSAESVGEVNFTLDSVFLGAAERLAIRLSFSATGGSELTDSKNQTLPVPSDTPSILLGELLSWVERVASEEGPQLLQDGGKDGATALTPVLNKLRTLVRGSLVTTGVGPNRGLQSPDSVPAGYATTRVQRAISELAKYLDDTADLARRIQR